MTSLRSIKHRRLLRLVLLLITMGTVTQLSAQSLMRDFDIRLGKGTTMTEPVRRSIFLSRPAYIFFHAREKVLVYLEESLSLFDGGRGLDAIIGVGPMARVQFSDNIPRFSLEAGVGVNLTSTREISQRQLGSTVLFSPTLSAGIEVPWAGGFLGVFYMFRHLSNASMFEDNDGINFQYVVFSMRFGAY